jgi:acyl transferase domain-containing protein/thioesterase domain-containing protein/acyl carrier protein
MQPSHNDFDDNSSLTDVAVIGIACRFPGADNLEMFWNNLVQGIETIYRFTKEELRAAGVSEELLDNPHYVRARGILNDVEKFDASFFGYNPYDAKKTDPQQKLFLECVWQALESAGYAPKKCKEIIGVYASMADSTYLKNNLLKNKTLLQTMDWFQARIATSLTTLSTQVSYRLDLTGPSLNITTACSSSLVSIATACRGLIDYDCDIAIAGAVAVNVPQKTGYLYQESGIESPDGHCRAFDTNAKGTVFSDGLGVVILKRLEDAIQEGDFIYAIIKGWSVNNDGSDKAGFTAPSSSGQAKCIAAALSFANVSPDSIQYVEAHGTGTALGDVIELDALTRAFAAEAENKQYCAIGSVKTNIGHADIAAGMAGFIKTVLSLKNQLIPASLNYQEPNPKIDFSNTPFYVNTELKKWDASTLPRRAGVNASGIGGTNAFLVLEEFQHHPSEQPSRTPQLLLLSAKTKMALEQQTEDLIHHLEGIERHTDLANIAFTLQVGRTDFEYRQALVCTNPQDALLKLKDISSEHVSQRVCKNNSAPKIVFMFSGQGAQYVGMGKDLYHTEPEFSKWVDECCNQLEDTLKKSVYALILGSLHDTVESNNTFIVQPALFILEYALAKFWMSAGVEPSAMIGHSLGEYVAACLAGVITLKDALKLISHRATLMAETASGMMLVVELEAEKIIPLLKQQTVSIAAINSPNSVVISGDPVTVCAIEENFKQQGISTGRLRVSHAFHSQLMEPILDDFRAVFEVIDLKIPNIPFISNLTGNWVNNEEVVKPEYWINHLRQTVRFAEGVETLIANDYQVFIEIGPGKTLSYLTRENIKNDREMCIQNTLPTFQDHISDQECFLKAMAELWLFNIKIDWVKFYQHEKRTRVPLATYPFQRENYWVYPDRPDDLFFSQEYQAYPKWFYEPSWERSSIQQSVVLPGDFFDQQYCWILFLDEQGLGESIHAELLKHHQLVVSVRAGQQFKRVEDDSYEINPRQKKDYEALVNEIIQKTDLAFSVINLFSLTAEHDMAILNLAEVHKIVDFSFYSLLFFTQILLEKNYDKSVNILMIGNEILSVTGAENIYPAKATVIGPCRVIPQEHPTFKIRVMDVLLSDLKNMNRRAMIRDQIIREVCARSSEVAREKMIAYRGQYRWSQIFRPLEVSNGRSLDLRSDGVYLVTGGLGGIGLTLAKTMASTTKNPRLVLISRKKFPIPEEWPTWLKTHDSNDFISKKILKLQEIESLGAKITLFSGDIADLEQCRIIIEKIIKDFGTINGVLHTAGVPGGGLVQLKTVEMASKVFASKVDGTYVLMNLLQGKPLDFFFLCSSVASVLGGPGQVDYCAANACLDAFAFTKTFTNIKSVNWNTWKEVGMAIETAKPSDVTYFDKANDILPAEGAEIFVDLFNSSTEQVIISTYNINACRVVLDKNNGVNNLLKTTGWRGDFKKDKPDFPSINSIEIELAKMWKKILELDKISFEDNFEVLGGHSLMALNLLVLIEKEFNVKVNLQALQNTNIKKLAQHIESLLPIRKLHSPLLIPIRSEGEELPLFCLHPLGGAVFCYLNLAKYLQHDCPIYGIQDPSLLTGKLLYQSVEEMAENYLQTIQEVQKHGPYLICGFSFGATLAVEIARQLQQKGEQVRPLILLDGWAKLSNKSQVEKMLETMVSRKGNSLISEKTFLDLTRERMNLLIKYKIPLIETKIILFKASELLPEYIGIDQAYNYWNNYTQGKIEIYMMPGNHETILEAPNVKILADQLDVLLMVRESERLYEKA